MLFASCSFPSTSFASEQGLGGGSQVVCSPGLVQTLRWPPAFLRREGLELSFARVTPSPRITSPPAALDMRSLLATTTAAFMVASSMLRAVRGLPSVSPGELDACELGACATLLEGSTQLPDGTVCKRTQHHTVSFWQRSGLQNRADSHPQILRHVHCPISQRPNECGMELAQVQMVGLGSKRVLLKVYKGRGAQRKEPVATHVPRTQFTRARRVRSRGWLCKKMHTRPRTISLATSHMAAKPPVVAIAVTTDIETVVEKQAMARGKRHVNDSNKIAFS